MAGWKTNHEWRCISYEKLGDFPASHVSFHGGYIIPDFVILQVDRSKEAVQV